MIKFEEQKFEHEDKKKQNKFINLVGKIKRMTIILGNWK